MKEGVTIKDIAKKLNMSVSTVSKALNNDASISIYTSERVKALAKQLNYIPNEAARHFKLAKSFTLGLIVPDTTGPILRGSRQRRGRNRGEARL